MTEGIRSMDDRRAAMLDSAGFEVVGTEESAEGLLPERAWRRIISLDAIPVAEIDDDPDRVDAEWRRLAGEHGLFADDGSFLISPPGPGVMRLPWVRVKLTAATRLAEHLHAGPGQPEFVTASVDGHVVLGVTSEEHGVWLVLG